MRSLRLFDLRVNGHFELGGPLSVHCLGSGSLTLSQDATYTVLATAGACALRLGEDHYTLRREHYAIATGPGTLHGGSALVIAQGGYRGCANSAVRSKRAGASATWTGAPTRCSCVRRGSASRA